MLACIQALVILDGRLMAACICSTMLDCACPGSPTGKPILWARVQGCEPLLRDHNPTHRASHKYSARILAHTQTLLRLNLSSPAFALLAGVLAQRGGRRQRPRGGRQGTGYDAPPVEAGYDAPSDVQPAYGADQDVYQVPPLDHSQQRNLTRRSSGSRL